MPTEPPKQPAFSLADISATLAVPRLNLGNAIALKHAYNLTRPYRHGNKKA